MKFVLAFVAILFLPFSATTANARVVVKETTKFYNVTGRTGKQVHAKFGRRGPWRLRRKHAIAATVREFDFKNIKFKVRGKKCVVDNIDVHLKLTYYYPKWINKGRSTKKTQQAWGRFSKELIRHEKTHGKYFKQTVKEFDKELRRVTGKISNKCGGMGKKVRVRLDKIYKRGEAKHLAFDRREKRKSAKIRKLERAFIKVK